MNSPRYVVVALRRRSSKTPDLVLVTAPVVEDDSSTDETLPTVAQALDTLLEGMETGRIFDRSGKEYKPATIRSYEQAVRTYLKPNLGDIDSTGSSASTFRRSWTRCATWVCSHRRCTTSSTRFASSTGAHANASR
jgi:hypothetical protein